MDFNIKHEGSDIKITKSMLSGKVQVFVNGTEVAKNKGKGKVYQPDENTKIELKNNGLDLIVPKLLINENEVLLARKLTWYEIILCFLPIPLLAMGGAIGGGLAVAGFVINLYLLRSSENKAVNIVKIIGNSFLVIIIYIVVAYFIGIAWR